MITNPLSRLEVIMQTSSINKKSITINQAIKEGVIDSKKFGLRGILEDKELELLKL